MTTATDFEFIPTSVKAAIAATDGGRAEMWKVPRKKLRIVPGFNVRDLESPENKKHVEALAASFIANGFFKDKPLAGYAGKDDKGKDCIFITDGHCRMAALDLAASRGTKIDEVPVILKPPGTSEEDLLVAMAAGNTGKSLSPMEMAELCKRLAGLNVEKKDIAAKVGITTKYFDDLMSLLSAPASIRKAVSSGKLSATEAITQIKEKGAAAAPAIEKAVKEAEATGRKKVTRKHIDGEARPKREKKEKLAPADNAKVTEQTFDFRAGQRLTINKIATVKTLAGGDWWKLNEETDKVDITANMKIEVRVTRSDPPPVEDDL